MIFDGYRMNTEMRTIRTSEKKTIKKIYINYQLTNGCIEDKS